MLLFGVWFGAVLGGFVWGLKGRFSCFVLVFVCLGGGGNSSQIAVKVAGLQYIMGPGELALKCHALFWV